MNTNLNSCLVSVEWLDEHISNPNLILLDATINKDINDTLQRIPKARFFNIKQKFSDTNAQFPSTLPSENQFASEARKLGINQDSIIIVYDDKGIYSSPRAWWLFKTFGFTNIAVLDGGLPEWKKKGLEVINYSDDKFIKGDFKANLKAELITDFNGVNHHSSLRNSLIVDARSSDRFLCAAPEPRTGLRRGTIPNSKNLRYTELLNGNKLKSKEQLSLIFDKLIGDKKSIIFSCGSGITACILALCATLCNYKNLIVYDGSWTEYGSLTV